MNELSSILDEMIAAGNALAKAATALKGHYSSTAEKPPENRAAEPKETAAQAATEKSAGPTPKNYSYEEVRQICAAKTSADDGAHKREVLDIIKKYADGKTLSKVDPSLYADLVAEVEAVGNA
nr:hypothetical protein [uncultured Acetatifactor sp.]